MSARLVLNEISARHLRTERIPIILTGGGGWLGQAALEMLDGVFDDMLRKNVFVFGSSARPLRLRSGRQIESRPLSQITGFSCDPALFLHFAFVTRDRVSEMSHEAFVSANRIIADLVGEAASRIGARGLFLPSSGAVYRPDHSIDDDMERNPYGVLKHQDEQRFEAFFRDTGLPYVIGRIFNMAGPFVNKLDTYALSSIIRSVQRGGPVEIRASRRVVRSYVHVQDVLDIVFSSMTTSHGRRGAFCFDTVGDEAVEIGDLASRVANVLGRSDCNIVRPRIDNPIADVYVGDGAAFRELVRCHGVRLKPLDQQIVDTADYLAKI